MSISYMEVRILYAKALHFLHRKKVRKSQKGFRKIKEKKGQERVKKGSIFFNYAIFNSVCTIIFYVVKNSKTLTIWGYVGFFLLNF